VVQKFSGIKLYNALAVSILSFGSEKQTNYKKQLTSIVTKFFRTTGRHTLFGHKRNEEILEEMKVEPVGEKLRRYKSNCP
jgi:hypothetical protein